MRELRSIHDSLDAALERLALRKRGLSEGRVREERDGDGSVVDSHDREDATRRRRKEQLGSDSNGIIALRLQAQCNDPVRV
jgi:hypothetical protein